LRAGRRPARKLFLLRDAKGIGEIENAAKGLPTAYCTRQELDKLAQDTVHQGVFLEADPLPLLAMEEWLERLTPKDAFAAVLDGIEDPHNFGAIVRTAAACGASGVIFAKDRSAPLSAAACKSAAGAMEYVDLVRVTNLVRAMNQMKEAGFWIAGLDAEADQAVWDADLRGRIALVVGNEGDGIRRLVSEECDLHLKIPLTGKISSLNASVSAAIALAECVRQRSTRAT